MRTRTLSALAHASRRVLGVAIVAILSSAFAATHAAVELPTSMTNDEVGFTISYPPAWVVSTYPGINRVEFDDGPAFLMVDAIELDTLPMRDRAVLLSLLAEGVEGFLSEAVVTELPLRMLGGLEAVGISYTGTDEGRELQGTFLVMVDDVHAFVIHFEAPTDRYDDYGATFAAMVESFSRDPAD